MAAITAAVAATAIQAAGTAYSASQATSSGGNGGLRAPRLTRIPQTPSQRGLEQYYTRILASNLTTMPPSFNDFVMSGGTARLPLQNLGMTPREAQLLGLIDKRGNPIPVVDSSTVDTTGLTSVEQQRSLGASQMRAGEINSPLARANQIENRANRLQGVIDAGVGPNRQDNIMERIQRMQDRITRLRG